MAALATLAAVGLCAVGAPFPHGGGGRSAAERFPCEACACGCPDAETCWRQCCCHTSSEKLAWAHEHGVTPPLFVAVAAEREGRDAAADHCDHDLAAGGAPRSCCERHVAVAGASEAASPVKRPPTTTFFAAMRCRGIKISTSALPPSLRVELQTLSLEPPTEVDAVGRETVLYSPPSFAVETPPPDVAAV